MYLLNKRVDQLEESDILRLVENKVQESRSLDYKRDLNLSQDKDKKEFIFDIASMYNTDGGCFVFGIEEEKDDTGKNTGNPANIVGVVIENIDKTTQQIEDLVKGNTEPRISNLGIKKIAISGKDVLVIGINKGLALPAMATFNESNKFYRRRNSGKYPVDVYELNQMFMQNQVLRKSAEEFRVNRINKVRSLNVLPNLETNSSLFIQIIPFSFQSEDMLDLSEAEMKNLTLQMKPMHCSGWDSMYNIDGYSTYSQNRDRLQKVKSYDQLFRNGVYECYSGGLVQSLPTQLGEYIPCFSGREFTKIVIEKVKNALSVLEAYKIEAPYIIGISLLGINSATMINDMGGSNTYSSRQFIVHEIHLPQIVLHSNQADMLISLKPAFDIIWQAAGQPKTPNYLV